MNILKTVACAMLLTAGYPAISQNTGIFDRSTDVGVASHKGNTTYDTASQVYELSGAGNNIWFGSDEFHYAWKKMKGDFILQSRGVLLGKGTELHRKFGWMVRNTLDSSSATVAATVHGDGLTSLQYRKTAHADMEEIQSVIKGPDVIQLERKGNRYIMSVAHSGEPFTVEQIADVNLNDELYVGLFICSHNKNVVEKVRYNNVRIIVPAKENFVPYRDYIGSHIEVMDMSSGHRKIVYSDKTSLQAPNWTKDSKSLIYNSKGLLYRFDFGTKSPVVINTGVVKDNNNDHVLSFDGKMLGLSGTESDAQDGSFVYTVPSTGAIPKQITPLSPSYLHGWSPDGKYLLYTARRNNDFDIYRIPAGGGKEEQLTNTAGLDDGSEYSPDGKYIYFNSTRSGTMQLWRMHADGSQPEQLTADEYNNWFPHISPDGKWIVFISFSKDVPPDDHPFYKQVYLRLMPVSGGKPKVIAYVYGGQATINTPSWSPDSRKIAFVSNSDDIIP
ncbi:WD40-like Beta Propeller Repeat [Chitinophaga sp. YR573]|uniref:TolB family protein n=1 Tax=Chitinophaga sp. YR573 TaxID=1881040 RepID=UPI0008CFE1AB|nr:PD40 domain-containing protein [Chitinophaga sp. YR573]SEW46068.1 WD40-like Beta Propeller Repeat [Chitinophaga sp. YR573]